MSAFQLFDGGLTIKRIIMLLSLYRYVSWTLQVVGIVYAGPF